MQAAEEAEAAADLLQKAEAALQEVTRAETAAAETGVTCLSAPMSLPSHLIFWLLGNQTWSAINTLPWRPPRPTLWHHSVPPIAVWLKCVTHVWTCAAAVF